MPKAKCPTCGTVVTYADGYDPICPKCGFRGEAPERQAVRPRTSTLPGFSSPPEEGGPTPAGGPQQGLAIAALVCGLVGIVFQLASIVAVVLGAIALGNANREPQAYGGKGMAIAGLVLGIVVIVFWILLFGAIFGFMGDW